MRRALASGVAAGLLLAALDLAFALATGARDVAPLRLALAITALLVPACALTAALGAALATGLAALPPRAASYAATALGAASGALAGVALFSGSGVRRLGLRPWGIAASVLLGALAARVAWSRRDALARRFEAPWARVALAATAGVTWWLHATVLVRQYALLHAAAALACASLLALARLAPRRLDARVAASLSLLLAAIAAAVVAPSHALRTTLRASTPVARYPAMALGLVARGDVVTAARARPPVAGPHLPLHGLDLVLVTVDALRADALRCLGGRGRTPHLDAVAARGIVFRRAYCATPHTSYSLASLMTGTYARSVLALPDDGRARETLASWLGEAGYATAGFFPPAVFAVDGQRFGALRARRFGFGTAVEGYADAPARVAEVARWLDARRPGERVFAWVHLFEPHEPYARHAAHPYGDDARARYDAECSAADDGIAALRAVFEARGRRAAWVITADHGEEFGEHGGAYHGTSVYDEQVRVPLVLEVPGVAPRVVDAPVSLVDLAPTLLGGVGLPRPPRLRGDNLGALALGPARDTLAFSATGSLRAVVSPRDKLVVDLADGTTELYDLARDPRESRNLADAQPHRVRALRAELAAWEASHARVDAERDTGEAHAPTMPAALERAAQGDVSTAPDVAALLGAGGLAVRRRAARVLGDLGRRDDVVTAALARELAAPDDALAREAALSLCLLGDARGAPRARDALARSDAASPEALRAAVGLARVRDPSGTAVLASWATRAGADDAARDDAVAALRALRTPASLDAWVMLLGDPRLAPVAAEALGELGDARALDPLRAALAAQRYPITARALADALVTLAAPDAAAQVAHALTVTDPLADAMGLLARVSEPGRAVRGATRPTQVRGPRGAAVQLAGGVRVVRRLYLRVRSPSNATLTVTPGGAVAVREGDHEVALDLPRATPLATLRLTASAPLELVGVAAR